MRIELEDVGKRFRREWILKHISYTFEKGSAYAVRGPNGSGKSTFLRLLSGHLTPSRGHIRFIYKDRPLPVGEVYRQLSYAGPYIDLIDEFTLQEALQFHFRFKELQPGLRLSDLPALLQLGEATHKPLHHFSSGMKQRLKLGLAILSATPLLLLDEPTATLDRRGIDWYQQLVQAHRADRLVVIASNVSDDYAFCEAAIDVTAYK